MRYAYITAAIARGAEGGKEKLAYADDDSWIIFCGTNHDTVNRQDDYQAILIVRLRFYVVERSLLLYIFIRSQ